MVKSTTDIAARLRYFRGSARLTQEQLARTAKLTPKFVSQIENGHVNPSVAVLMRLVQDGLQISLAVFFATDTQDDLRDDLTKLADLFAIQPPDTRRRALRILQALCAEHDLDGESTRSRKPGRRR